MNILTMIVTTQNRLSITSRVVRRKSGPMTMMVVSARETRLIQYGIMLIFFLIFLYIRIASIYEIVRVYIIVIIKKKIMNEISISSPRRQNFAYTSRSPGRARPVRRNNNDYNNNINVLDTYTPVYNSIRDENTFASPSQSTSLSSNQ